MLYGTRCIQTVLVTAAIYHQLYSTCIWCRLIGVNGARHADANADADADADADAIMRKCGIYCMAWTGRRL